MARTSGCAIAATSTPAMPLIDRQAGALGEQLTDQT